MSSLVRSSWVTTAGRCAVALLLTVAALRGQGELRADSTAADPYVRAMAAARVGDRATTEAALREVWHERRRDPIPVAVDLGNLCLDDGRLGDAMVWALRAHYMDPRSTDAQDILLRVQRACGLSTPVPDGTVDRFIRWFMSAPRPVWVALVFALEALGVIVILLGRQSRFGIACGIGVLVIATGGVVHDAIRRDDASLAVVATEGSSLRAEPHGERLGGRQLRVGTEVRVLGATDAWTQVRVGDDEGYLERSSLLWVHDSRTR